MQFDTFATHKHLWKIVTVAAFFISFALAWSSGKIFASTVSTSPTAIVVAGTSFSVMATDTVDCTNPLTPTTKVYFSIDPETSGKIYLKKDGVDYGVMTKGQHYLPSGSYSWIGAVKTSDLVTYSGENLFSIASPVCLTTSTSTTSFADTSSVSVIGSDVKKAAFSVTPTTDINCDTPSIPQVKVVLATDPINAGNFNLYYAGFFIKQFGAGSYSLPNGDYSWSAIPAPGYTADFHSSGNFNLSAPCKKPDTVGSTSSTSSTADSVYKYLSYLITLGDVKDCSLDVAHTIVTSTSSLPTLTKLMISDNGGASYSVYPWGQIKLDNGSYKWRVEIADGGHVIDSGVYEGSFTLNKQCSLGAGKLEPIDKIISSSASAVVDDSIDDEKTHYQDVLIQTKKNVEKLSVSDKEKKDILTRVNAPESCSNEQECKVFCEQKTNITTNVCTNFIHQDDSKIEAITPSFLDGVDDSLLNDLVKKVDVPEGVNSADDLKNYCSDLNNQNYCSSILLENNLATTQGIETKKNEIIKVNETINSVFENRVGVRAFIDTDGDGVTDYDELKIYHTNEKKADTDGDGYLDGVEILYKTNPSVPDANKEQKQELPSQNNPLIFGNVNSKLLALKDVEVTKVATSTEGKTIAKEITFTGHSEPNSFVTLYLFSDPIVVTIKTDSNGDWKYTLDKELPDGSHRVVTAITDKTGRVLAKSETIPFVKVAEAITVGQTQAVLPEEQKLGFFSGSSLYLLIIFVVGIFIMGILAIGSIVRRRKTEDGVAN